MTAITRARLVDHNNLSTEFDTVGSGSSNYGYLVAIDIEHHKIHEGHHFTCQNCDADVDAAAPKYWHVKAPAAGFCHVIIEVRASNSGVLQIFEEPTLSANGTELSSYNNNRNSTTAATLKVYDDPTVTSTGTKALLCNNLGTTGTTPTGDSGGQEKRNQEFILKQGASYIVKFAPDNNDTRCSLCVEWYEVI